MLTVEQKQRINALSDNEMAYEINRGRKSIYQNEKFDYLKSAYELRLLEKQKVTANSPTDISNAKHDWHNMPLGKIAIGVVTAILAAMCIVLIGRYFGIILRN